jgi:succinoglycan biosynthesis transport protein ExoP
LLIDADMRSPSIHALIDQPLGEGLSNYLSGTDDLDRLMRGTDIGTLSVVTAGPQPLSTPELLGSDRFARLMTLVSAQFDHVLIDLPPVMGFADAPLIASQVEGTVVMIAANSTHKNVARLTVSRLRKAHAHLLGGVLTMFDAKQASYGYGYGHGYGFDYGDKNKSQN